jgi:tetratricopeptide (TPR) repeat protein
MLNRLLSASSWVRFVTERFHRRRVDIILAGMHRSFIRRVWKAVQPPPPLPARRRLNRAQRRLIRVTSITVALGVSAWAVYAYIASAPDRASGHYQQGIHLLGPGDFQGADTQFTQAIAIFPKYADAYLGRGKARQAAGQINAALADFEKAIAINPTLDIAYIARGTIEASQGNGQKALEDFTRSIRLHPTADGYYQRGLTYQKLNQPKLALADYNAAITYDPGAPSIYMARARVNRDLGDLPAAEADQEQAALVEKTQ